MAKSEDQKQSSDATDFTKMQSDIDKAKNNALSDASRPDADKNKLVTKTDTARKKTGGGKQVNPGM
jgi:hypothetical protein